MMHAGIRLTTQHDFSMVQGAMPVYQADFKNAMNLTLYKRLRMGIRSHRRKSRRMIDIEDTITPCYEL
jgi:hypothetical protein